MNFIVKSLLIFLIGFKAFHPVHISIINMDYYQEENKITFSLKVFEDDLKLMLVHLYQVNTNGNNEDFIKENIEIINTYIANNLKIKNDSNYKMNLAKHEFDDESILFFYNIELDKKFDRIEIMNTIFLDLYFDQKNMLICNYKNSEKGFLFDLTQTKHILDFNEF